MAYYSSWDMLSEEEKQARAEKFERERREEQETVARLRGELDEVAQYIASKMPDHSYTAWKHEDYSPIHANITDPNGYGLHLSLPYSRYGRKSDNGKLFVTLTWGNDHQFASYVRDEEPRISLTFAKGKERIWKDIERRVIPHYLTLRERVAARKQKDLDDKAQVEAIVAELERRTKGTYRRWENGSRNGGNTLNITGPSLHQSYIHSTRAHLRLDLDTDVAIEVLELVAKKQDTRSKS